jgi:hypothetical protein
MVKSQERQMRKGEIFFSQKHIQQQLLISRSEVGGGRYATTDPARIPATGFFHSTSPLIRQKLQALNLRYNDTFL